MTAVRRQRGWAFVIVLLALAIAAWLARDALTQYLDGYAAAARPAGAKPGAEPGATQAAATPQAPVERARGVEATVLRSAEEAARQRDAQAR